MYGGGSGPQVNTPRRGSSAALAQGPRDVENVYVRQVEEPYPLWWTSDRLLNYFCNLPEDTMWNTYICVMAMMGIVWVACHLDFAWIQILDIVYNVSYAVHVFGLSYSMFTQLGMNCINFWSTIGFLLDMVTFSHYVSEQSQYKLFCYYLRLHRPLRYLWELNDYNLKGSVFGTTLKYCYIFVVLRVTWALAWLHLDQYEARKTTINDNNIYRALNNIQIRNKKNAEDLANKPAIDFLAAIYLVNKMFIPIGPSVPPANDLERLTCLVIMLSGCLAVTASAVASLSLVISLYMRPEETFRARYRLMIKEMKDSRISTSQSDKVETFYKMYWHKQRAVSFTQLLPTFPPTLPATVYTDIYFEATQKSLILRDLSYQFLSELSKRMETIHYIPGDSIIKRSSMKSNVIFITYGDIEMVTAEDDSTAILRMTRGSVLTPCGPCAPAGLGRAHLDLRAATFCTAHVLRAIDLWRVAVKYGNREQTAEILGAYKEHMDRVKRHYKSKVIEEVKYKSSILHFKRCLMALKEAKDANGNLLLERSDFFLDVAGCYIMRNLADATLTDEADAICLRPTFPCILQPTSSLQHAWHFFVASLIVAVVFIHPYFLVFRSSVPIEFRFFDYVVTAIFVLDLIVHLSTGANVEEGVPITLSQTSSQQMRNHWFVFDVLGTLPIFELIGSGHFAGLNKILRLPKVFRVLKGLEDVCVYRSNVIRFLSYTLLLLIACYLIAALQQGFMCFHFDYCVVGNLTHSPYWENSPLEQNAVEKSLSFALYWAISMIMFTSKLLNSYILMVEESMLTHMETWGTESWSSVLYTLCVLEICIVLRIFMEAVYSATILVTTALREDYDACILSVKNFLIRNKVDPVLRQRFITYLQLCWLTDKAYAMTNKRSIFYDLPSHVYQDIVATQRSKYMLCIPFMKYVHKEDLKEISSKARLFYTSPNEIIINTGEICNEMYVVKQGICEVISPETKRCVGYLSAKCHFGVFVCLMRIPAFYTVRAATTVQVFSISRKHLLQAIQIPQIKDTMDFIKTQPEYQGLQNRREPFIWYKPPDPTPNMERFRLPRKHEPDSAFLVPFYRLGFLSVLRYIFPRFTLRPDGRYLSRHEWVRAACALAAAALYPGYTYLALQYPVLYYVTLLLDLAAYFDILQRMLVGYYNEQGILVYHPSSTAAHYLKGAFCIDLLGALPLENLETPLVGKDKRYRITQTKQLLMLNRLLQLHRLPSAMRTLHGLIERGDILMVLKAIPLFMVLLNILSGFIVLYSANIYSFTDSDRWLIEPIDDEGGSWIQLFSDEFRFNITETPWNLHLTAFFWVVYETSTTGYSNFKPSNVSLIRVLFVGMLIGAMIITYFSVRIISIRANVNIALAEFQQHMKDMLVFMRREKLSPDLQKTVIEYYEYNWEKMGGVNYRNIFKLCDQITLRTDAILHIYGATFAQCPILAGCDLSLLRIVGRAVHSRYFLRGMSIIKASDVISEIYFVDYGDVNITVAEEDTCTVVKLPRGSVFGNLDGEKTVRCPDTFIATSRVHLLMINSQTFHHIISDFPSVQSLMKRLRPDPKMSYIMGNDGENVHSPNTNTSSPTFQRQRKSLIKYLFSHDRILQAYLISVSLLCIYIDVYNAGFQDNSLPIILTLYVLDLCFAFKVIMQIYLPHIVDTVSVKQTLMPMRKAYFKKEFKYDILSCVPIELFCFLVKKRRMMYFSCLRLNRTLRIVTVYKSIKRHNERIANNLTLSTGFSVFIWFTMFVHIATCIWYFIGAIQDDWKPKSSWMYKDDGTSWCENLYICSVYFVLTTFTQNGVGDIMPKNHAEVIYVCILEILSTMIYMIYVGEISNIMQYQSFRSFTFYAQYLELQEFMKNNRVSRNLVSVVNRYTVHLWRESRGVQAPHFLCTAPSALRLTVMAAAYLRHLNRHHIFEKCEPEFLRQLVGCLQLFTYNENMYVVKSNEITDSMYLIHTGKVEEIPNDDRKAPRIYPTDSYFGVLQGLTHNMPFKYSYRTLTKSQVLTLRLDDWLYLLKHFPACRDAITKHMPDSDDSKHSSDNDIGPPKPPEPATVTEIFDKSIPPTPPKDDSKPSKIILPSERPDMPLSPQTNWSDINKRRISSSSLINNKEFEQPKIGVEDSKTTQQSSYSHTSQVSQLRGPQYLEEVPTGDTNFLEKVTETAKKLIGLPSSTDNTVSYSPSDETSGKDVLLIEEQEAATEAILEEINVAKNIEKVDRDFLENYILERVFNNIDLNKIKEEENKKTIAFDTSASKNVYASKTNVKADIFTNTVDDLEPSTSYDRDNGPENDTKHLEMKDEATSTSKLRRSIRVRYEDESMENKRKISSDLEMTERNLRMLDSDMHDTTAEEDKHEDPAKLTGGSNIPTTNNSQDSLIKDKK